MGIIVFTEAHWAVCEKNLPIVWCKLNQFLQRQTPSFLFSCLNNTKRCYFLWLRRIVFLPLGLLTAELLPVVRDNFIFEQLHNMIEGIQSIQWCVFLFSFLALLGQNLQ